MTITKKSIPACALWGSIVLILQMASCVPSPVSNPPGEYSPLVDYIEKDDRFRPLYVFNDFEEDFDEESHRASLGFFNAHPALLKKIKKDIKGRPLRWRLDNLSYRFVFVPEEREDYAVLFKKYCEDVVDYVLNKTELVNPYHDILTLSEERPDVSERGVTVFLVHNLAKEYVAKYEFRGGRHKKVVVNLEGTVFSGRVGAYTTEILLEKDGGFHFIKNHYTIWQNSAKNPYTALKVPVEETLHIALRKNTEQAIQVELESQGVHHTKKIERIVDKWMAVEEAVVGGLAHALLPPFVEKYFDNLPPSLIDQDVESLRSFPKYRFLNRGIEIVENLGYRKAIEIYQEDPGVFKDLLSLKRPAETMGNPMGGTMGKTMGKTMGNPMGNPMGYPMGNPMGNPL
jgi:hypothetical protein